MSSSDEEMQRDKERRRAHRHKKRARRMEEDLNRTSFRSSGEAGRPPPDKVPRTTGADPCDLSQGDLPFYQQEVSAQPHSGAIPVIVSSKVPPQWDSAAAVASVPTAGHSGDGSVVAGMEGVDPAGFDHGAGYGGQLTTRPNSSLVNDDEAASRVEYRYQDRVRGYASRTPAYGDPYGSPGPNVRSRTLRTSFDSCAGESQSLQVFGRIEDVLARMERHMASTATSQAPSAAPTSTPSTGEFINY